MFRFKCSKCEEWHEGVPAFATAAPAAYEAIPEGERERRCILEEDACVIDDGQFFIRGLIEIPVKDTVEPLVWNVWASINEDAFSAFVTSYEWPRRSHIGPFGGRLAARLPVYPDTESLKVLVRLRDDGLRPKFELEPAAHSLPLEQMNGIDRGRLVEIFEACMFGG